MRWGSTLSRRAPSATHIAPLAGALTLALADRLLSFRRITLTVALLPEKVRGKLSEGGPAPGEVMVCGNSTARVGSVPSPLTSQENPGDCGSPPSTTASNNAEYACPSPQTLTMWSQFHFTLAHVSSGSW